MRTIALATVAVAFIVSCKTASQTRVQDDGQAASTMVDMAGLPLDLNDKMYTIWLPYSGSDGGDQVRALFPNDRDANGNARLYRAFNPVTAVNIMNANPGQYAGIAVTTGDGSKPYYLLKGKQAKKNYYALSFKNPKKTGAWNTPEQLADLRTKVGSPDVKADYLIFDYQAGSGVIAPTSEGKLAANRSGYAVCVEIKPAVLWFYETMLIGNKTQLGVYREYSQTPYFKNGMGYWRRGNVMSSGRLDGEIDVTMVNGDKWKEVLKDGKFVSETKVTVAAPQDEAVESAILSQQESEPELPLIDVTDPENPATQASDPFVTVADQASGNPFASPDSGNPSDAADAASGSTSSDANSQDSTAHPSDTSHGR